MRKAMFMLMCLVAMSAAGTGLEAQEVTIVLNPGWTWISYPGTEPVDIVTALGSFTPKVGDVVASEWSASEYIGGEWLGDVDTFYPGYGYMYYSTRMVPVTLTFNAQQPAPQVVVTTSEPTDITASSATSGGSITTDAYVFAKGICWATHANPTQTDDYYSENGAGNGSFTAEMTDLSQSTTYYVRAYAVTWNGITYGNEVSFTTIVEYEYVDLGLPSGLLWATCNLGADIPEDYGDYFAWGETQPKDNFSWTNYQYCMGSFNTLTKYCNNPDIGYNGFTDDLTTLLPEDDAATANWGDEWRMPTEGEWQELYENTTVTWTMRNGVRGRLFTATNGNSIFLPAAGYCNESLPEDAGIIGDYWTSSLDPDYPSGALSFFFNSSNYYIGFCNRLYGRNVRAVRSGSQSNIPTGAINGKFTINEDGDQIYFSQGNLQYQASTNAWRFADNQFDFIGGANTNISSSYNGWIDLFGWGTSGYHNVYDSFNVNYQPYSASAYIVNNECNYYGFGPSTNMYDPNLTGTSAEYDWGIHNAIDNGGDRSGVWRTLTDDEWAYLFFTRSSSTVNNMPNARFIKAKVNDVGGVILFPDVFSVPEFLPAPLQINNVDASFNSNSYSIEAWNIMESMGCVFLPAAGFRDKDLQVYNVVYNVGECGYYWSTTYVSNRNAHVWFFGNIYGIESSDKYRYVGASVRLVCDVE